MNLLLDSNALLWISRGKVKSLGKEAYRIIQNSDVVYFSSLSVAEFEIKAMLNKGKYLRGATEAIMASGLVELNFNTSHAQAISNFPSLIRHDPFDRLLLAQAYSEQLTLLTSDQTLLDLGLDFVADARE